MVGGIFVSCSLFHKSYRVQRRLDLWIRHELLPDQPGAVVFDHDHDWGLIQAHIHILKPVLRLVEAIAKSVDAPQLAAQIAVEVLQRLQRFLGRVGKRS